MPTVIAVVGRKGGQGKSTLAVTLAAVGASDALPRPFRFRNGVVLVDCDSQANASQWALSAEKVAELSRRSTVAALECPPDRRWLENDRDPLWNVTTREELFAVVGPSCVHDVPTVPGLRIVPASPRVHPESAADLAIDQLPADLVIVDTGADCSQPIVRAAIQRADIVICPTVPEPWGVHGVEQVLDELRSCGRSDLYDRGGFRVVVSRRERNRAHDACEKVLRDNLRELVSPVVVPKSAAAALVSGSPGNLTTKHPLRRLAAELLQEVLFSIREKERAA